MKRLVRAIGVSVIAAAASGAQAQTSATYGSIDVQQRAELLQWGAHFWNRVDSGETIKSGTFAFSLAEMNGSLFFPLRANRPTLEQVGSISETGCDSLENPAAGDAGEMAAFRSAMTGGKVVTDAVSNSIGWAVHSQLVAAAPAESVTSWVEGTSLVSVGLPLIAVSGSMPTAVSAGQVSQATIDVIGKLITTAPAIAQASKGVTRTQALITGEIDEATRFANGIRQFLLDAGSNGTPELGEAVFGVFGSLPLLCITFDDAFVLADATNGNVIGPFAPTSPLDARGLLVSHNEYVQGSPIRYYKGSGCPTDLAYWWPWAPTVTPPYAPRPALPPGTAPVTLTPPWGAPPITLDPTVPGWETAPVCVLGVTCVCTVYGQMTGGPPGTPILYYRDVHVCPPGAGCPPPGFPAGCFAPTRRYWR